MTRIPLISLAVLAVSSVAAADPKAELHDALRSYRDVGERFVEFPVTGIHPEEHSITGCHEAIEKGRAAGVPITEKYTSICQTYVGAHQLAQARLAIAPAYSVMKLLERTQVPGDNEAHLQELAARCTSEVDRLLADGMPTAIAVDVSDRAPLRIAMKDARTTICNPLAKIAATFAKDAKAAAAKRLAQIAAPYKAAGAKGDRLELLVDHVDYAMYGIGGGELTTAKQLAKASVIFELLGPNTADGTYTLRRYQFRGNKLASTTSRTFRLRPASKHFR